MDDEQPGHQVRSVASRPAAGKSSLSSRQAAVFSAPSPDDLVETHPVSPRVNGVRHHDPELIRPVPLPEPPAPSLFD